MSETAEGTPSDDVARRPRYEAPQVIAVGNARDLLAGGSGSLDDAACGGVSQPLRNSDEPCP